MSYPVRAGESDLKIVRRDGMPKIIPEKKRILN